MFAEFEACRRACLPSVVLSAIFDAMIELLRLLPRQLFVHLSSMVSEYMTEEPKKRSGDAQVFPHF